MTDRLEEVLVRLRGFVADREWAQFHDPKNLAMAVASEAGELLAEYRWVASEAADVGISLLLFCDRIGVDLVEAISRKIELNAAKYPVVESRGRHSRSRDAD